MTFAHILGGKVDDLRRGVHDKLATWLIGQNLEADHHGKLSVRTDPNQPADPRFQAIYDDSIDALERITSRFMSYADLAPAYYDAVLDEVGVAEDPAVQSWTVYGQLESTVDREHNQAFIRMINKDEWGSPEDNWQGTAAAQFQDNFVTPFQDLVNRHKAALATLSLFVKSYRGYTHRVQVDLKKILKNALSLLEQEKMNIVDALTVISLGLAFIDVGPEMLAIEGVIGTASLGTGVAGFVKNKGDEQARRGHVHAEYAIEGFDALSIIASINAALDKLEHHMMNVDFDLGVAIDHDLQSDWCLKSPDIELSIPAVCATSDLGRLKASANPPGPIQADTVVAPIVKLYEGGRRTLPEMATCYDRARHLLGFVSIPHTAYSDHWTSSADVARLFVERIQTILSEVRDVLSATGAALVRVATNYELTDGEGRAFIDRIDQLFPPETEIPVGFPV